MIEQPEKLNNQAILLAADGAFNEAIACFKRAITIQKDNYLLWYNLGITYRDAGKLLDAQTSLATAFSIAPENMDVEETYATVCLMNNKLDDVRAICTEGLDFNPLHSHLWNLLGVAEFQSQNYNEASEFFEQAVYINPYYTDAIYNLMDTYTELHNKKGAQECAARIRELSGK